MAMTPTLPLADETLPVSVGSVDQLLTWGLTSSLWVFPMATSCCAIELMAAAASRVDLDRMGTIVRATPRQADVMVVAGTITVKMAPRVKRLWDQMPEPKWCIAMGSCATSGDFYRDLYAVVPGIDTFLPVDVYIPGCPPNPEGLMHGLLRLKEKVSAARAGRRLTPDARPELLVSTRPSLARTQDADRTAELDAAQTAAAGLSEGSPVARPSAAGPAETEALPVEGDLAATLRAHGVTELPKDAPPLVPVAQHEALARALQLRGFRQLAYVVASHWPAGRGRAGAVPDEPEHFEVAYGLRAVGPGSRLAEWSVRVPAGASVPSLAGILAGADWQEREQWDLVGVGFAGHPDLRRLMLPDDFQGHPLRKDYPADSHQAPWR